MFNLPDHPEIESAMKTGYPSWNQPKTYYCDRCGCALDDGEIFEDDNHEYLCVDCLCNLYEKRW